jgi:hypothetical protein
MGYLQLTTKTNVIVAQAVKGEREFTDAAGPSAGEDVILKASPRIEPREDAESTVAVSKPSLDPDEPNRTGWGRRTSGKKDRRYQGWLPGAQPLTFGEVLAGTVATAFVCFIVAISLSLAGDYWVQLPDPVANGQNLISSLCGLVSGLYIAVCRRSSRLARRAHLRGERFFAKAESWEDLVAEHDVWLERHNTQRHGAHERREDGKRSPAEVLGAVRVVRYHPVDLQRAFFSSRFTRTLDALGYARFRHWRLYAEVGLACQPVAVWLGTDGLNVEYAGQTLANYDVFISADAKLTEVTNPRLFVTRCIGRCSSGSSRWTS